jgi:propionate catabolism operon transcriptional regulator
LRVLQEREVLRLGASEPTPVDIRIIAATHCDLRERIIDGRFREDLYYRVNILRLNVVPLRERTQDIPILAKAILQKISRRPEDMDFDQGQLRDLMPYLLEHRWPGNIRELENIIERAALSFQELSERKTAEAFQTLFPELFEGPYQDKRKTSPQMLGEDLRRFGKATEVAHVRKIVDTCNGDLDEAARRLGISRTTLWRRLRADTSS